MDSVRKGIRSLNARVRKHHRKTCPHRSCAVEIDIIFTLSLPPSYSINAIKPTTAANKVQKRRVPFAKLAAEPFAMVVDVAGVELEAAAYPNCWLCEKGVGFGEGAAVLPAEEAPMLLEGAVNAFELLSTTFAVELLRLSTDAVVTDGVFMVDELPP